MFTPRDLKMTTILRSSSFFFCNLFFRIHEEKKKRISFPISNPRFQEPNSPVEKIRTPGPAKKMVAVNRDKGSGLNHCDEDEGSSPDSALGTCPSCNSEPPTQEIHKPAYFTFEFQAHQSWEFSRGNPHTHLLCFFLSPVNLSVRLVVVFQDTHAWSYLESNIYLSFAMQDALRSVSCNPPPHPPLFCISFLCTLLFSFLLISHFAAIFRKSIWRSSNLESLPFTYFSSFHFLSCFLHSFLLFNQVKSEGLEAMALRTNITAQKQNVQRGHPF